MDPKHPPHLPPESLEPPTGLKAELSSFLRDGSAYLRILTELFSIEAKEAGQFYGKKTVLIIIAAALLGLAYLLILTALIGILGAALNPDRAVTLANWTGALLIFGGLHLITGFIFFRKGKKRGTEQALFPYTRAELKKNKNG